MSTVFDIERAVNEGYSRAAHGREPQLCCPVEYEPKYLTLTPNSKHRNALKEAQSWTLN
jgi:hypothetical protein